MFHPDREYPFIPWSAGLKSYGFEGDYNEVHPETRRMTYFRNGERPRFTTDGQPIKGKPERSYIPKYPYYYTHKEFFHICKNKDELHKRPDDLKQDLKPQRRTPPNGKDNILQHQFIQSFHHDEHKPHEEEAYKNIQEKAKSPINKKKAVDPEKVKRQLFDLEKQKVDQQERKTPNILGQIRPSSTLLGQRRPSKCPHVERKNVDGKKMIASLTRPTYYPLGLGIRGPHLVDPNHISYLTSTPANDRLQVSDVHRRKAFIKKNDILYPVDSGVIPKYSGNVPGIKFRFGKRFGALTKNAKEVGKESVEAWGGIVSLAPSYHPPPGW